MQSKQLSLPDPLSKTLLCFYDFFHNGTYQVELTKPFLKVLLYLSAEPPGSFFDELSSNTKYKLCSVFAKELPILFIKHNQDS